MGDVIAFLLGIPSRLKLYAAAILAAIAGALAIYAKGRADAKARAKTDEQSRKIETLETAREVKADVDQKPVTDVRRDLSDWVRPE